MKNERKNIFVPPPTKTVEFDKAVVGIFWSKFLLKHDFTAKCTVAPR